MSKKPNERQRAAQTRKAEAPTQADRNICPKHRRYVHLGTACKYCAAGYRVISENEMIIATGEIVSLADVDRPNLGASADSLRKRLGEVTN
ncbi:hypothetical protein ACF07B_15465 [Streptomyces sp. NPDC015532]|uniref:hypothetical protein n=1 Tax=Streptomyces sp. NPDC015532 TaxID=3364960 RepID=UPI003702C877